jgi:hypothetical protein
MKSVKAFIAVTLLFTGSVNPVVAEGVQDASLLTHLRVLIHTAAERGTVVVSFREILAINELGDSFGFVAIQTLGDQPVLTASGARALLSLVRLSFARPAAIKRTSDRSPQSTLKLLDLLQSYTGDDSVIAAAHDETAYLQSLAAKQK